MGTQITAARKPAQLEGADLARLAAKADSEVESRALQLGARLNVERRWMFPTAKNSESLSSYQIVTAVSVAITSDADRLAVLEMIEKSMSFRLVGDFNGRDGPGRRIGFAAVAVARP